MKSKLVLLSVLILTVVTATSLRAEFKPPARTILLNLELVGRNGTTVSFQMTVYSDGFSILAQRDPDHPEGEICESRATPESMDRLKKTLRNARIMRLAGTPPLANRARITVNYFDPIDRYGHTTGNTFGYSALPEPYLTIDNEFTQFFVDNFSDCE